MSGLESLRFDNAFVRELPADPDDTNRRRQVLQACYSRVHPTPVRSPRLLAFSREMAQELGLAAEEVGSQEFLQVFAGNRMLPQMQPYAACYGGHQFGNWAGQLGDGRAISLGEVLTPNGARWELQLKGAGPTPYSRTADGRAVVRSSVREFLCSEAMHHLGVPTTRALSLTTTGEQVVRDMFYDGRPAPEPGAVVCRVAPSFLRFGNFEIFAARRDHERLQRLADYAIDVHFPHVTGEGSERYLRWFDEIARRTVDMIAHWMRVGFVHGVMNTDNMSIHGLTIDYGPYGWLDDFDPDWTPNTTDAYGRRYRYGHQPQVAFWNLLRLAEALVPLVGASEPLEQRLRACRDAMQRAERAVVVRKLGLLAEDQHPDEQDELLGHALVELLASVETDMTLFYRALGELVTRADDSDDSAQADFAHFEHVYYAPAQLDEGYRARFRDWLGRYRARLVELDIPDELRRRRMHRVNPKYVLRNYLAQLAIDKAEAGDGSLVEELLDVLRHPYDEQPDKAHFAEKRPEWARHRAGCSMLSCSS